MIHCVFVKATIVHVDEMLKWPFRCVWAYDYSALSDTPIASFSIISLPKYIN